MIECVPAMAGVAEALATSERSLQRKLQAEGVDCFAKRAGHAFATRRMVFRATQADGARAS